MTKNPDMLNANATRTTTTSSSTMYVHRYVVHTRGDRRVTIKTSANGHMRRRARARARGRSCARDAAQRLCCLLRTAVDCISLRKMPTRTSVNFSLCGGDA